MPQTATTPAPTPTLPEQLPILKKRMLNPNPDLLNHQERFFHNKLTIASSYQYFDGISFLSVFHALSRAGYSYLLPSIPTSNSNE